MTTPRFVRIGGIRVVAASRDELAEFMIDEWRRRRASSTATEPMLSFSANGEIIALYGRDPEFRAAIDRADMVTVDGMPAVLISKALLKNPVPERVATTDFFHDVARLAQREGMSFYMLGAREDVNRRACEALTQRYPRLKLAGRRNGYFAESEEAELVQEIATAKPDILWVALGTPKQHYFCIRHRASLKGTTWIKTCGGLFDFVSGSASRAPLWMQRAGLEWVYRMMREPIRLGKRYLATNPYALWRMLLYTRGTDEAR